MRNKRLSQLMRRNMKKRFKIKEYVQHGEAASAEIDTPNAIAQMEKVRGLAMEYGPRDTFNMDETSLFWKLTLDRTLATKAGSGGKKAKDRITLALTVNGDGSDKLKAWVIGKSKNPRCFRNINRQLFREYLRWLDNKMRAQGRKILLLLDNFAGHELGVQLVGGLQGLSYVRIEWLPPNTTSCWQPLDQGIIASFKLQYRRQWVSYMLRQYEAGKDPNKTVTLLKVIQWTRSSWEQGVTPLSIEKCFWKSTVFKKPEQEVIEEESQQADRDAIQAQIAELPGIEDPLPLNEFIEPVNEVIDDEDIDIFASVVDRYSTEKEGVVEEPDEDDIEIELVSITEALKALDIVKLWEMHHPNHLPWNPPKSSSITSTAFFLESLRSSLNREKDGAS
ncbi:hypothetical protein LIPSTDRAFT_31013 [Lipomyces starkeyi NRRL Y-11557]|uniref:DDE-1 domain-containing protein n=1 Tax=Lipomyces starkeyi NRRL Y-11557 TaxID=675824 RepID=A0A1E3PVS9_LIPST|nr:hypothetical protein LIPSTDRAFT_31013 [Lipomyces starkeyi NRRL Y-11557]